MSTSNPSSIHNTRPGDEKAEDELDKIIGNLLEDHIDMYSQDRDSSAALGADIEAAKIAILAWHYQQLEAKTSTTDLDSLYEPSISDLEDELDQILAIANNRSHPSKYDLEAIA